MRGLSSHRGNVKQTWLTWWIDASRPSAPADVQLQLAKAARKADSRCFMASACDVGRKFFSWDTAVHRCSRLHVWCNKQAAGSPLGLVLSHGGSPR